MCVYLRHVTKELVPVLIMAEFFFFFCLLASFFLFLTESGLWEHLSENFILIGRTTRISIARRSLNRMPTDVEGGGENNGYIIPESYTSGSAMLIEKV